MSGRTCSGRSAPAGSRTRLTRFWRRPSSPESDRCSGRTRGSLQRACGMRRTRMKTFDSWAWVEYFRGSRAGQAVRAMVEGDEGLFTPAVCLTELKAQYMSEGGDPGERLQFMKLRPSITSVGSAVAEHAAALKIRHRFHPVAGPAL